MIKNMGIFWTPKTTAELQEYIKNLPPGETRAIANAIMGFTWNLCAELTQGAVHKDAAFMLQYLARGIDSQLVHVGADEATFNEWLTGEGDLERSYWLQDLAVALQESLPEEPLDMPWSDLCYQTLEYQVPEFIVNEFIEEMNFAPAIPTVVEFFKTKVELGNAKANQAN